MKFQVFAIVGLRPDQEDCPTLIFYKYKKLIELGVDNEIFRCDKLLNLYLSESQYQDFKNKVSQLKEYKEWKLKHRTNKLMEDF